MHITPDDHDAETIRSTAGKGNTFEEVMQRRISRRTFFKGVAASTLVVAAQQFGCSCDAAHTGFATPCLWDLPSSTANDLVIASSYQVAPLLCWGDPLTSDAPPFDPNAQTAEAQALQFGYNCDFVGFLPVPAGSSNSSLGLLVVNHEYTNPDLMFPSYDPENPTQQ